jgi:hypothetical protein
MKKIYVPEMTILSIYAYPDKVSMTKLYQQLMFNSTFAMRLLLTVPTLK